MFSKLGVRIISLSLLATLVLWLRFKYIDNGFDDSVWHLLGQVTALLGTVFLAWSFILSSRWRWLESWFGGLDQVYKVHHIMGGLAFVFLTQHPMSLALNVLPNFNLAMKYFWFSSSFSYNLGILAFYVMVGLLIFTFLIKLPFGVWKRTHEFFGLTLLFGLMHTLVISSDVSRDMYLRAWMIFWLGISVLAYVYIRFLYGVIGPKHKYIVEKICQLGDVIDMTLKPLDKKMKFWPGQFAYLQFAGFSERHPFSVASKPTDHNLRFGIKILGDNTLKMKDLPIGTEVSVWGGYGKFGEKINWDMDMVFVAGGIGLTPFLSILESVKEKPRKGNVYLYYCFRDMEDRVFQPDVMRLKDEGAIDHLCEVCSSKDGRLSVEKIATDLGGNIEGKRFFLCAAPAMMADIKTQLINLGVNSRNIINEDFNYK